MVAFNTAHQPFHVFSWSGHKLNTFFFHAAQSIFLLQIAGVSKHSVFHAFRQFFCDFAVCDGCIAENYVFKPSLLIADSAHLQSVPLALCRLTSFRYCFCHLVRVNLMVKADCYRCRIHIMYLRAFFPVQILVAHKLLYHFMIALENPDLEVESVNIQGDNLLEAQSPFRATLSVEF